MNERIKELAAKSNFGHMENGEVVYDYRLKKFAELIVQECITINKQELSFNAFEQLMNKYNDHFGVNK